MNKPKLGTLVCILGAALASSCSDDDGSSDSATSEGGNGTIPVLTLSGKSEKLTGTWVSNCYMENGTDAARKTTFDKATINLEVLSYTSADLSCTGAETALLSFTADVTVFDVEEAIAGWFDGMEQDSLGPEAQDGSGPIPPNVMYTQLRFTFTAVNFPDGGPAVGDDYESGYILDDTGPGAMFLYDVERPGPTVSNGLPQASIADPFLQE